MSPTAASLPVWGWFSPLEWGCAIANGIQIGMGSLLSRAIGIRRLDRAQRILSVGIIIALFFAIVITVAMFMPSRYCAHWGGHERHHRLRNGVLLLFAADRVSASC